MNCPYCGLWIDSNIDLASVHADYHEQQELRYDDLLRIIADAAEESTP